MKDLLDERLIAKATWECLKENDPDGGIEVLEVRTSVKNKCNMLNVKKIV